MPNGINNASVIVMVALALGQADIGRTQQIEGQPFVAQSFVGPPGPKFSFSTSALLMGRTASDDVPRVFRESDLEPVFSTGDIDFSAEAGVLMEMTFFGDDGQDLLFRYVGLNPFHEASTISADEPLLPLLFGGIPATPVDTYQVDYLSQLHSGEINHRWRYGDRALIAGLRFIELREEFNVFDADGVLATDTDNDLYGIQVGADFNLISRPGGSLVTQLRVGGYYNNADVSGDFIDPQTGADLDLRDDEDVVAFAGELNILGRIAMGPSANLLLGYNLLWLDGIGLAPDQLDGFDVINGGGSLNKGTVLFHGGQLGVELVW